MVVFDQVQDSLLKQKGLQVIGTRVKKPNPNSQARIQDSWKKCLISDLEVF